MTHRLRTAILGASFSLGVLPVLGAAALGAAVLSGCGGSQQVAGSAQEAYTRGTAAMERGRHARAIEHFRTALDFGRTSPLAADAQLALARAYAADRQHLLAGSEYTRFIEFYRVDPRIEQAAFERIQSYAALSPRFALDQTDTKRAIEYVRLYLSQYPEGEHAAEAIALQADLRAKLARKAYENGRLYESRDYYQAARITYEKVLQQYPVSEVADDALLGALRAQVAYADASVFDKQAERYREALALYDQFTTLFPQSEFIRDAEALYQRAFAGSQASAQPSAARSN